MDGSIHPQRVLVDCRDGHDLVSLRVPVPVHLGPGEEAEGTQTSHTSKVYENEDGSLQAPQLNYMEKRTDWQVCRSVWG